VRVSTPGRPRAAAVQRVRAWASLWGFNTQPPEGGCVPVNPQPWQVLWFQHTAARRRLPSGIN